MRKLFLIAFMLSVFMSSIFAQTIMNSVSFSESAKSRATSSILSSDSDYLSAKDIFQIERAFFSAGYLPALTYGGSVLTGDSSSSMGTMSAFWAMPIDKTLTVGFSGEYQMNATKTDTVSESYTGTPFENYTGDALYRTENYVEASGFKLRPVVKWGDNLAFHYALSRSIDDYDKTIHTITTADDDKKLVYNREYVVNNPSWQHEIGVAYKADKFTLYVPLGMSIDMGGTILVQTIDSTSGTELTSSTNIVRDTIYVYLNPEFVIPFEAGSITQLRTGLNTTFRPYDAYGARIETDTSGNVSTTLYSKDQGYACLNPYFTPTFEWKTLEDKISMIVEPTVGFTFAYDNDGLWEDSVDDSIYDIHLVPYLNINLASTISVAQWFELRAGISYGMTWKNTITTILYSDNSKKDYSELEYQFYSTFGVYTGFGFIVGEDFFIDVYMQAGNGATVALEQEASTSTSLFNINAYGVELSYRF